jgi:thioredoxin-dependent peroxiredoxin
MSKRPVSRAPGSSSPRTIDAGPRSPIVDGSGRWITALYYRAMPVIEAGQKAPAFSLPDQHGTTHSLADYAGRPLVLYFYPKDDTSGCTKEACTFQAALPNFDTRRAAVLGVSVLDSASKAKFAKKYALTFPLLADADHAVAERYGAWQQKSMYGRKYMGIARITYLIGPDGRVVRRWDSVKPAEHAAEVLAAVTALPA